VAAEFGNVDSSREDVMKFYQEWSGFSTLKQFAYVDQYNPNDAPNRRIKRLIEQDNKRERQKERNKFNDKLRDLLAYIRSKDPRIEKFAREDQIKKDEKRREEELRALEKQEELRKYRAELAEHYKREEEEALAQGHYEEVIIETFNCAMCKKTFKKDGQLQNHLQSKQHKKVAA
jgi:DnaJ homolog subfamily A member 5